MGHHLFIVLPARNEAVHLDQILTSIPRRLGGCDRVTRIVVDDGSDDATGRVAARAGARVVRHAISLGKGAALRTGCDVAMAAGCDFIALMDADGQHRAADLPALVLPLTQARADLAVTYRSFTADMPAAMRIGNLGLSSAFFVLFGARFRDTQCGLRAFSAEAYSRLRWQSNDYAVETEMLIRAARLGLRVAEAPIDTVYHERYKGTTVADGARIFAKMLHWRLVPAG